MKASDFEVGQEVILLGNGVRCAERVTVTKIGRTNVYVDIWGRDKAFRIEDGSEVGDYNHYHIRTDEEQAAYDRRSAAWETLRGHGLEARGYSSSRLPPTETLEAIAALLEDSP